MKKSKLKFKYEIKIIKYFNFYYSKKQIEFKIKK